MDWNTVKDYEDITFKVFNGVARIAFNRPEVRNAFRPKTVDELLDALIISHESPEIGVVLLTGEGPSPKDGGWAFCSGGDQRVRAKRGYKGLDGVSKFNILDVQRQIRFMNKVVIAVVPGWAVGGGHSLHVVCDLTIASKEHAIFKQTDADVASFAKKNLKAGEKLDGEGGFCARGRLITAEKSKKEMILPLGLTDNAVLKRDIIKDEVIRLDDVELNLPNEVSEARNYQYNLLN